VQLIFRCIGYVIIEIERTGRVGKLKWLKQPDASALDVYVGMYMRLFCILPNLNLGVSIGLNEELKRKRGESRNC